VRLIFRLLLYILPCYNVVDLFLARLVSTLVPNTCPITGTLFRTSAAAAHNPQPISKRACNSNPYQPIFYLSRSLPLLPMLTMSSSHRQAHRHWKKSPPSNYTMDLIRQVHYDLDFDEDENDGMFDIYEINILQLKHKSRSHWRRFPAAYFTFLKRLLYRFELYLRVHDVIHGGRGDYSFSKDSIRKLRQYIQYMDGVIMEAWEQCRLAAVAEALGAGWRCPALDRWLLLEFYVNRHGIEDLERYIENSGVGLNDNPFTLGRLDTHLHMSYFYVYILAQIGPNMRRPSLTGITVRSTITRFQQ